MSKKIIFHIDLNAYFASVAIIKEPYLENKVFAVGGTSISNRGVITTASYKARALGIKSGMSISDAQNIYPEVIIVPTDFSENKKYSEIFFNFLKRYSNKVLKGSIDEAYVDMTELAKTKDYLVIASEIMNDLNTLYKLPVSIGISHTLFLAKMASDLKKPLGITVINEADIKDIIHKLPIKDLYGVGIKTYPLLEKIGIKQIGDFLKEEYKNEILKLMTQENYLNIIKSITGKSSDVVDPYKYDIPKSISNEQTFNYDIDNIDLLNSEIEYLFNSSYSRLVFEKLLTKTVNIKIRYTDFTTLTRSKTLNDYTKDKEELKKLVEDLFLDNYNGDLVRLLGVGFSNIILEEDLKEEVNLFTYNKYLK